MNPLASPEARKKLRRKVICEFRAKLTADSALLNSRGWLHPISAINSPLLATGARDTDREDIDIKEKSRIPSKRALLIFCFLIP